MKSKHDTFSFMIWYFPESPDGANTDHPTSDVTQRVGTLTPPKPMSVRKQKGVTSENFLWGKEVLDAGEVLSSKRGAILFQKLWH